MKQYYIYGPPGTGKTRVLARRHIPRAIEKYGPDKVMVTSFTRAAAKEIAGRDIQVNEKNVGTLHSICYHAFGQPNLAVKHIKKWNEEYPRWALSGSGRDLEDYDSFESQVEGDQLMSEIQVLKARLVPQNTWKISLQSFMKAWDGFKKELGVIDFDDLIENALEEFPIAPNSPAVMFLDEAQDFTPVQFKLIRSWGMSMDWFVMCGDDDQTLYSWLGSDPEALINPPVPKEFKTILKQSWRVPAKILQIAGRVIEKVSIREPKEYRPRMDDDLEPVDGEVIFSDSHYKHPDEVLEYALEYIKQPSLRPNRKNKNVMFLASCSYMLEPLKKILRDKGIPFHNPYRRRRYDWNPFYRSQGVSSVDLLNNFLSESESDKSYWSVPQFLKWAQFIRVGETGLIKKQGKEALKVLTKAVEDCAMGIHTTREVLHEVLSPSAINAALNRDIQWLQDNILKSRSGGLIYPLSVLKNQGVNALREEPGVILGTVHSVKGGEVDMVVLFPDLSRAAYTEMDKRENEDAIRRMFYVGMTRAYETLILCSPTPPPRRMPEMCFEWPDTERTCKGYEEKKRIKNWL
jgi:DNA helicase II / ATP-dependent DNA helicase PcrA